MKVYDRETAIEYAKKWAYKRNPLYYNFDAVGGDCTSFVSQCLYAGSRTMNYSIYGWYYRNGYDKSASWSGVEYLYKFIINNTQVGPYGRKAEIEELERGDIIQLSFDGTTYGHTLIITDLRIINGDKQILVSSHTQDNYNKNLYEYKYIKLRGIKVQGVR